MDIEIIDSCKKELKNFPEEVLKDFLDAVAKLKNGLTLSMPLSRKIITSLSHVYELRLKDRTRQYRVIYFIKKKQCIYIVHAFVKKSAKTPKKNLNLTEKRIRRLK